MPGLKSEAELRRMGFDVVLIDHHFYKDVDRRASRSSLEQLMELVRWPASATDTAIAINDRSYIPGLKQSGLTEKLILQIRAYDRKAQGEWPDEIERMQKQAKEVIPKLEKHGNVYVMTDKEKAVDGSYVKEALAIQSPDGLSSMLELFVHKIGFSGKPAIAKKLIALDFTTLGYERGAYNQYGGGDPGLSMFFGFKPKKPPAGEKELIPQRVMDEILKLLE